MHEIEQLADTCSVFRNGRHIETFEKGARSDNEIVRLMIGREYTQVYPAKPQRTEAPAPALAVRNLSWGNRLKNIRSEEHTSELQSLMRISYAVFRLKKKKRQHTKSTEH